VHVLARLRPAWPFDQVRRAALALALRVTEAVQGIR